MYKRTCVNCAHYRYVLPGPTAAAEHYAATIAQHDIAEICRHQKRPGSFIDELCFQRDGISARDGIPEWCQAFRWADGTDITP